MSVPRHLPETDDTSEEPWYKRRTIWRDVPMSQWRDWRWQMRHRVTTAEELARIVPMTPRQQRDIERALERFRFAVPPYYASLIDPDDPECPIRLQAIPGDGELAIGNFDIEDPLNEDGDSVAPGMTHRYPDRVLWVVMHECAMLCRHCTRKRKVGERPDAVSEDRLDAGIAYLQSNPEVRDVLFSGGDPLLLSDDRLERILERLRNEVPSVEIIRFGTRVPVTMPQRITPELVEMLKRYHPVFVNTHFNVPKEFTHESEEALRLMADAGIPLGNQSVLLRGVNDCWALMRRLMHKLTANRVRPYYTSTRAISPKAWSTSERPSRRASRSWSTCAATSPGSRCRHSWSTRPAAAARSRCTPTMSCRSTKTRSCCATSRAGSWPTKNRNAMSGCATRGTRVHFVGRSFAKAREASGSPVSSTTIRTTSRSFLPIPKNAITMNAPTMSRPGSRHDGGGEHCGLPSEHAGADRR